MITQINPTYNSIKSQIENSILHFNATGTFISNGKRNKIKYFESEGIKYAIKSFKKPNFINRIIYKYFRKSKAKRSFEYANLLIQNEIGTPKPIAFYENTSIFGLKDSYYVCEHLECDLTYRELVETDYPDAENILRQFTRFTYEMHKKGIEFLDHSPGNTLIIKELDDIYSFYLVDLNRMKFHKKIAIDVAIKNFSRLTPKKEMVAIMSNEYSKLSNVPEAFLFEKMWKLTAEFQYQYFRKKRIKKRLKFWKK